jgi:hypothetical protein
MKESGREACYNKRQFVYNACLKISTAAIPEKLQSAALITEEMSGEGGSEIHSINSVNEAMISGITSLSSSNLIPVR